MPQNESSIIILKPTSAFLSFIAMQLPDVDLPDLDGLQNDHTAYTIRKCNRDDVILEEIERFYPFMFRHELSRIVGDALAQAMEVSFIDFLFCFKFELHSQMMLLESTMDEAHQLLCVKPRSVAVKWMETEDEDQIDFSELLEKIDVSHFIENATVLVKNFEQPEDIEPFIEDHFQPIVHAEMERMSGNAKQWPSIDSFQMFHRYFDIEIHTQLVHLH